MITMLQISLTANLALSSKQSQAYLFISYGMFFSLLDSRHPCFLIPVHRISKILG